MTEFNPILLEVLACPICKGKLRYMNHELVCVFDKLAYPIQDGVPMLLVTAAKKIKDLHGTI